MIKQSPEPTTKGAQAVATDVILGKIQQTHAASQQVATARRTPAGTWPQRDEWLAARIPSSGFNLV